MTQDSLSEYGNTIMIIDFCQFLNDGQGNWLLLKNIAPTSYEKGFFQDDEEKKKYEEQIEKAKSDFNMLLRLMGVASTQYEYSRDTYGYMLYKQANLQSFATLYLKKSDYTKVVEANKKAAEEKAAAAKKAAENVKSQQSTFGGSTNSYGIQVTGIPLYRDLIAGTSCTCNIDSYEISNGELYVTGIVNLRNDANYLIGSSTCNRIYLTFYLYDGKGYQIDEKDILVSITKGQKFKKMVFRIPSNCKKISLMTMRNG